MPRPARALTIASVILVAATIALSVLAARHDTLPGDVRIMSWAQDQPFPGEALSHAVRGFTTTHVTLATGLAAAALLALLGQRRAAVVLGLGLVLLPLVQWAVKEAVDRPRPVEPLVDLRTGYGSPSFPAGHVMSPTLLYGFLLYLVVRDGLPVAVRALAGAWSAFALIFAAPPNIWLGVHWPSDVLGAWAWALVLLLPMVLAMEVRPDHPRCRRRGRRRRWPWWGR